MENIEIKFGYENFANYRRLAYKWWYALAEFVDNSTQSFLDNEAVLTQALREEQERLKVIIATDKDFIRISDNALGMDQTDLSKAMMVGVPPDNATGRCRYGLGMKTAACWIGNRWRIVTTKLGVPLEFTIEIDVEDIARGNLRPPVRTREVAAAQHYTSIEITAHNRPLRGRTISKVKEYLGSIYRLDIASGMLLLRYDDVDLEGPVYRDDDFLKRRDGTPYKTTFIYEIETEPDNKVVEGWVGVLQRGSRSRAGFSILHRKRVIRGWPDSWRPEKLFGEGGRNDLINQRLVGEVNLEDFEVSHTKDEINWHGDEEELVETGLRKECLPYMETARKARGGQAPGHGPAQVHVDAAVRTLEEELSTPDFLEKLELDGALPPPDQIAASNHAVVANAQTVDPVFSATLGTMTVRVYIDTIGSPNDPYYVNEDKENDEVVVVVNAQHPHWTMLEGENAVANYLRHCVYDAVAEYRASRRHRLEPDTIKLLKDQYLRVSFEILQRDGEADDEE
jgi:hypothetical protein